MAPRGLGLLASMFLLGSIAKRGFDTRPLVALGFVLIGVASWQLGSLNLTMSMWDFMTPTIFQGIGMGLIFPNLSAAALSSIPREQMGYGASLFSMSRNIGGSIGTSVLTTLLVRREQIQQSYLVDHFSVFDAWRMSHAPVHMPGGASFNYMGSMVNGQMRPFAMIYSSVQAQSMMISLNDIYRMLAYMMIIGLLLTWLLPRARGKAPVDSH